MSSYSVSSIINASIDMDTNGYSGYNYFPVDCSGGSLTITLPTNVWDGLVYIFNRTDSNALTTLTLNAHTGTIQGGASLAVSAKSYVECVYLGSNWMAPRIAYL